MSSTSLSSFKNIAIGIIACVAVVLLLSFGLNDENAGAQFVERFGLWGLFAGILFIDSIPTPGGAIPLMALCIQGGVPIWMILLVCLSGSSIAAIIGYFLGHTMGMPQKLEQWMEKKHPNKLRVLRQKGLWGIAALSSLPIPISFGTWAAGALQLSFFPSILLALAIRIPKILFYLWTILGSFSLLS